MRVRLKVFVNIQNKLVGFRTRDYYILLVYIYLQKKKNYTLC